MADKLEAKLGLNTDEFNRGLVSAKTLFKDFAADLLSTGAALAGITEFFSKLKDAFKESDEGAKAVNATLAIMDQYLYDIANKKNIFLGGGAVGLGLSALFDRKNLAEARQFAKDRHDLEVEDRQDRLDQKDIENEIQKALFASYDNTKSRAEQEEAIRKAMELQSGLITMKLIDNKQDLDQVAKELTIAEDKTKLLEEQNQLQLKQKDIEAMQWELRRQKSRLTSMEKQDQEDITKALREQGQYLSTGYKVSTIDTKNTPFGGFGALGFTVDTSAGALSRKGGTVSPAEIEKATNAIRDQEQSVAALARTFGQFFSGVNMGFQGMVDGIITGLKRLVMELIAEAAFLAILAAFGVIPITSIPTILAGMHGVKPGGISLGGGTGVGNMVPNVSPINTPMSVDFKISNRDLVGALKRT